MNAVKPSARRTTTSCLTAPPASRLSPLLYGDEHHGEIPKFISSYSWAFGSPRTTDAGVIDDEEYAEAPSLAAVVTSRTRLTSRSAVLLPEAVAKKPHQMSLAIEREDIVHEDMSLPVAVAMSSLYAVPIVAAKAALAILSDPTVRFGGMIAESLGELAVVLHGNVGRIQIPQIKATATALAALRDLFIVLPDGGAVQLFDVKFATVTDPTLRIDMGLTRTAITAIKEHFGRKTPFNGTFIYNFTGAMKLPNENPRLLRHYVRAASHWNAAFHFATHRFDKRMLPKYDIEQWAIVANALPPAVVEYIQKDKKESGRAGNLRSAKSTVWKDLDELADRKLIRLDLKSPGRKNERLFILPTPAWIEVKEQELKRIYEERALKARIAETLAFASAMHAINVGGAKASDESHNPSGVVKLKDNDESDLPF